MLYRRMIIVSTLLATFCSAAAATVPSDLLNDFSPLTGLVLLDHGEEVLIDLTAEKGVRVGDLFSVVSKGEIVKHPVTGAPLGTLDEIVGELQIVQLRPGFSIARRIDGEPLKPGAEVRRFDRIAAKFYDSSAFGEPLFIELRERLPHLQWQKYTPIDSADLALLLEKKPALGGLAFCYDGEILEVRGPESALLRRYEITPEKKTTPAVTSGATALSDQTLATKWLGGAAKGLPIGLAATDFDGDGRVEIARAFEDRLEISRLVGTDFKRLATHEFRAGMTVIALSALDLNSNGRAELFVTTVVEDEVRSEVLEFSDGQYNVIASNQPWFFSTVLLPEKGAVLLGQRRDRSYSGFAPEIYHLEWKDRLLVETVSFTLPEGGMLYSLAPLSPAGKGRYARINSAGRIEVFSQGAPPIWVSGEKGESETGFLQADAQNPNFDEEFLHKVFLPAPLIPGPKDTIITAMNSGLTGTTKYRQMHSLTLTGWHWRNQELLPLWQIKEMAGYVPAMTIADADNDGQDELVLLIAHPDNSFFSARKSVLKLLNFR
ncbi:MAG: hypothetical protein IBX47_11695 [Desulfuromonadales bacterium]|nr:hypothetical protein [Desulfuromonadales bacterium]